MATKWPKPTIGQPRLPSCQYEPDFKGCLGFQNTAAEYDFRPLASFVILFHVAAAPKTRRRRPEGPSADRPRGAVRRLNVKRDPNERRRDKHFCFSQVLSHEVHSTLFRKARSRIAMRQDQAKFETGLSLRAGARLVCPRHMLQTGR